MDKDAVCFSVVMCTFNAERHVEKAVQSVLLQSLSDFELIIVDDGSTDGTKALLESFQDARISLVYLPQNRGLLQARSVGFGLARGRYIALMDSDDICEPDRLELQRRMLDSGGVDVCGAFHRTHYVADGRQTFKKSFTRSNDLRALLLLYSPLCNPVVSFRRSLLSESSYRAEYEHAEDYGFWCELSSKGATFANVPKPLLTYFVHTGQISQNKRDAARQSFLRAQRSYQQWLGMSDFPPEAALTMVERIRLVTRVMRNVYAKIGPVSPGVCMEFYRACQFKKSPLHSLWMRAERLWYVAGWYLIFQHVRN